MENYESFVGGAAEAAYPTHKGTIRRDRLDETYDHYNAEASGSKTSGLP